MLTLDLKKSNDNLVVHGKLILYLSTNTSQPISNPGPSAQAGIETALANMGIEDSGASLSPAAASTSASASALSRTPSHQGGQATPQAEQPIMQMPTPQINRSPTTPSATTTAAESETIPSSRPVSGATTAVASGTGSVASAAPPTTPHVAQAPMPAGAATNASAVAARSFNPHEDHLGPLPPGWERRIDPLGRTYYVDHKYVYNIHFPTVAYFNALKLVHGAPHGIVHLRTKLPITPFSKEKPTRLVINTIVVFLRMIW